MSNTNATMINPQQLYCVDFASSCLWLVTGVVLFRLWKAARPPTSEKISIIIRVHMWQTSEKVTFIIRVHIWHCYYQSPCVANLECHFCDQISIPFNIQLHVQSYGHPQYNTLWTHSEQTLNTLWTHSEHTLKKFIANSTFSTATYLSRYHPRATSRWCRCTTVFPEHELPATKESDLWSQFERVLLDRVPIWLEKVTSSSKWFGEPDLFFWNSLPSSSSRAVLTFGSWRSAHTRHQNFVFINSPVPFHWNYNYYHGFWNRPDEGWNIFKKAHQWAPILRFLSSIFFCFFFCCNNHDFPNKKSRNA